MRRDKVKTEINVKEYSVKTLIHSKNLKRILSEDKELLERLAR